MGLDCAKLEAAMQKEIEKTQNEIIPEKEFQKLKNQVENQIVTENSTIASRANILAEDYTYYKDANRINTDLSKYMAVTPEDLKRVANDYFRKDNRVVLYYLPKSSKK